ncbi:MAG: hypothetical protein LBF76_02995 [Holosporales bacterium]|jgi:hypothetical protein|nr:hypothetical protein [Holosporales bacterium]
MLENIENLETAALIELVLLQGVILFSLILMSTRIKKHNQFLKQSIRDILHVEKSLACKMQEMRQEFSLRTGGKSFGKRLQIAPREEHSLSTGTKSLPFSTQKEQETTEIAHFPYVFSSTKAKGSLENLKTNCQYLGKNLSHLLRGVR